MSAASLTPAQERAILWIGHSSSRRNPIVKPNGRTVGSLRRRGLVGGTKGRESLTVRGRAIYRTLMKPGNFDRDGILRRASKRPTSKIASSSRSSLPTWIVMMDYPGAWGQYSGEGRAYVTKVKAANAHDAHAAAKRYRGKGWRMVSIRRA